MSSKKTIWKHKKFGKREFEGGYRMVKGERHFTLELVPSERYPGQKNTIVFESPKSAKDAGWIKK